ncbi:MAG TPA: TetR/AcrR family transcriptional regulator [Clostridiaceae bacterium]|nr:TetR/AcrR family transcriptional regulator [Clostridiaceae bacterium]
MPKPTFFNLPEDKRNRILEEAVIEFRDNNYDAASINKIVERSGISKGSFYQSFNDKEDVYLHIMSKIGEKKIEYLTPSMLNFSELSFYDALREMYRSAIEFALENPDYLEIGNRMMRDNSGILQKLRSAFSVKGDEMFITLLRKGQETGDIRLDLDLQMIAKMLISMQMSIVEYYFEKHRDKGYSMEIMDELDKFFDVLKNGIS